MAAAGDLPPLKRPFLKHILGWDKIDGNEGAYG
jgi:hypothetical protein